MRVDAGAALRPFPTDLSTRAAAHAIYGVPTVINTANYVYFIALERVQRLGSPEALAVFVSELLRLHRGQGQDIAWRDSGHCPTEEEYQAMVLDSARRLPRPSTTAAAHPRAPAQRRGASSASPSASCRRSPQTSATTARC